MAYTLIFLLIKCEQFLDFFSSKNICELDIVLIRTVNILTTNELDKLTMLWTPWPWSISVKTFTCAFNEKDYTFR